MPLAIAISKIRPNYAEWIRRGDPSVSIVDLSVESDPKRALAACDALVLTGGEDVHPARYGHQEYLSLCEEIDEKRDALEADVIEAALARSMPVLAICRGEQLVNVALGGTLFADIYKQHGVATVHTKDKATKTDAQHAVDVAPASLLHKIAGELHGEINSAHHQAVDSIAPELRASATAPDGTVEAIEWNDPSGHGYMLGVQWHPERMAFDSPFSKNILIHFLFEAESFAALHARSERAGENVR